MKIEVELNRVDTLTWSIVGKDRMTEKKWGNHYRLGVAVFSYNVENRELVNRNRDTKKRAT